MCTIPVCDAAVSWTLMVFPKSKSSSSHLEALQCAAGGEKNKVSWLVFLRFWHPFLSQWKQLGHVKHDKAQSKTSLYEIPTNPGFSSSGTNSQYKLIKAWNIHVFLWNSISYMVPFHIDVSENNTTLGKSEARGMVQLGLLSSFSSPCRVHLPQHFIYVPWTQWIQLLIRPFVTVLGTN